jgi:hypothetical protein
MMLVKANRDSEAGVLPSREVVAAMGKLNEDLAQAGVLPAAEGLHASSKRARVKFDGRKRTVTDGPFAETKELLAGFWLIEVKSKQEAIAWASRIHFTDGEEVEVRQVFEASDFGPGILPPDDAAREQGAARGASEEGSQTVAAGPPEHPDPDHRPADVPTPTGVKASPDPRHRRFRGSGTRPTSGHRRRD